MIALRVTSVVGVGLSAVVAGVAALVTLRTRPAPATSDALSDVPAAGALPAVKLRLFYGALVIDGLVILLTSSDAPLYLTLLLVFAGVPILGHQSIGLTPARHRSRDAMRWWWLGWAFPLAAIAVGVALVLARAARG